MFVNQPEIPVPLVPGVPVPGLGDPARPRPARRRPARCARSSSPPTRSRWSARGRAAVRRRHPVLSGGPRREASCTPPTGTSARSSRDSPGSTSSRRAGRRSSRSPAPSSPTWSSSPATSTTRRRPPPSDPARHPRADGAARAPAPTWSRSAATTTTAPALDALRPWADAAGITLRGTRAATTRPSTSSRARTAAGERWRLVALPFLSQRYAVRAVGDVRADRGRGHPDLRRPRVAGCSAGSTEGFGEAGAVNLVTAHLTVVGASHGRRRARGAHDHWATRCRRRSSRPPRTTWRSATCTARSRCSGPCPVRYSGSPLAIDFGEEENVPVGLDRGRHRATPRPRCARCRSPAATRAAHGPRHAGPARRRSTTGEAWLRVYVREPPRAGLREEVQELLPRALEVRIDPEMLPRRPAPRGRRSGPGARRASCSPTTSTAAAYADDGVAGAVRPALRGGRRMMRPLRLDMRGFTVFREPTTVDFTDADFFALVGPTGVRQVHRARRDLLRALRHGAALGRRRGIAQRARPVGDRGPGAAGLRVGRRPLRGHPGGPPRRQGQRSRPAPPAWSCCRAAST